MKKILSASLLAAMLFVPASSFAAQDEITLPTVEIKSKLSVMQSVGFVK